MENKAHILVGLGFGDEGKGTMTDFLCRKYRSTLVVRYNGGSQAGHNVVLSDGRHHTFSQFGSGSFVPGVKTLLSKYVSVDPISLACEASVLSALLGENALQYHMISSSAPIVTPFHIAANRLKEWMRGSKKHGSCGKGVGELASDLICFPDEVIKAGILGDVSKTKKLLKTIQFRKYQELVDLGIEFDSVPDNLSGTVDLIRDTDHTYRLACAYRDISSYLTFIDESRINQLLKTSGQIIFEGAQGVLLDEWHGFHPYTTWSTTIPENAFSILKACDFSGDIEVIGILRCYHTRHGVGPFVTDGLVSPSILLNEHNIHNDWQDQFRVGGFDGIMMQYAAKCAEVTALAVTHLDTLSRQTIPFCDSYVEPITLLPNYDRDLKKQEIVTHKIIKAKPLVKGNFVCKEDVIDYIENSLRVPVVFCSFGPTEQDKVVLKKENSNGYTCRRSGRKSNVGRSRREEYSSYRDRIETCRDKAIVE